MVFSKRSLGPLYVLCFVTSYAAGMNFTKPYAWFLQQPFQGDKQWQLSVLLEKGFDARGFNENGCKVNPLQIYSPVQNAIAMLKGFSSSCEASQLLEELNLGTDDDGLRGRFNVTGCLESRYAFALGLQRQLPMDFFVSVYVPFYGMRLSGVRWKDKTRHLTAEDERVHEKLSDNLSDNVKRLGCLSIAGWDRSGLGDMGIFFEWARGFKQSKPFLKNVRLHLRAGATIPTGLRADEDKIFALPFGNDGAVALLFGGDFAATMGEHFKLGFAVQLQQLFGHIKSRRIKTDVDQTSLLLLRKECAFKDTELSQEFNLFAEFSRIAQCLSLRFTYEFTRQGDSKLSLLTYNFPVDTANTAKTLEEYTMHNSYISLCYDGSDRYENARVIPMATLYLKAPFNGKFSALAPAMGLQLRLNF